LNSELAIIHFGDIGKYPPAFNLVRYFASTGYFNKIVVCSRTNFNEKLSKVIWCNTINREKSNKLIRLLSYLFFYSKAFWYLTQHRPPIILYYETLSFPPVYLYKNLRRWWGKTTSIYCHYHEYTSLAEYKEGMKLNMFSHYLENKSYNSFTWISHTNNDRIAFFLKDHPMVNPLKLHVLPNYPPRSWKEIAKRRDENAGNYPLKIVYVGSLDLESMYTKEFVEWVILQKGKVLWDVYLGQLNLVTQNYFSNLNCSYINFKGSILYDRLPEVLVNYHVGVILYKGHIPNYIYNEPNKYFEYYVCGLDVWYPKEMVGMHKNMQNTCKPFVTALDFKNIPANLVTNSIRNNSVNTRTISFEAEIVYEDLIKRIS